MPRPKHPKLTEHQRTLLSRESVWLADPLMPKIVSHHQNAARWMQRYSPLVCGDTGQTDPQRLYRLWNNLPLADPAPRTKSQGRPRRFATAAAFRTEIIKTGTRLFARGKKLDQRRIAHEMQLNYTLLLYHLKFWRKQDPALLIWDDILTEIKA